MTRNFLSTQERTQLRLKENGDLILSLLLKSKFLIATISTWLSQLFFSDLFFIHDTWDWGDVSMGKGVESGHNKMSQ